jgi:hypothetical protein
MTKSSDSGWHSVPTASAEQERPFGGCLTYICRSMCCVPLLLIVVGYRVFKHMLKRFSGRIFFH